MDWNSPLIQIILKLVAITVAFVAILMIVAYTVLAERRVLAFIQGRLGPNRVGYGGMLQPFADLLKFILKEDIVPDKSTRFVYFLAPVIAIVTALMTMIVYPFGPEINLPWLGPTKLVITQFDVALLYVLGITSVGVYGIALAGWSSNNKYSLMGGLRSSAQLISYELALGLSLVGVVLLSGTLNLYNIVEQQSGWYGMRWNIWKPEGPQIIGFIVYLISAIAETNRVPFDLPEAETELVAGFHTEYSAMKFALFFMAEYVNMLTVSMLATTLFLGGWNGPGVASFPILGVFYFLGKVIFFLFLYIWLRGTLPRFRFDQLMNFGWKFLLPVAILNIILTATWAYFAYAP
ncbi:MAG: NADH-quinone oxidoreductase subunit [Acidobacteriota bacterium]|jgi:NADH-quinone oxidoreductase subunit H|nr:NADH-quinone oxidoreductase subunit [Acidobacteriota bacterium]MDT5059797.1 NADH-quinone oxidoreductase subunit [Acidobacteriota bacterium]